MFFIKNKRLFSTSISKKLWYPKTHKDLDIIANRVLEAGTDLKSDHPGFNDLNYRNRRLELATYANNHSFYKKIPYIKYNKKEIETWGIVLDKLEPLLSKFACNKFLKIWPEIKHECGYRNDNIPQGEDIKKYLVSKTGFNIRPCSGLLSSRDFLNGLAFKTFFCTQYIRHSSVPLYTPEPDICHEFIGHVPMFADPDFAELSYQVGIASLGASDEIIDKLARCYWFSVEFGLTKEDNKIKAYGAGLLSSFGEIEYACSNKMENRKKPKYLEWDTEKVCNTAFPITEYQPIYFISENLENVRDKISKFCKSIKK